MPSRAQRTGLSTVVQLLADGSHLTLETDVLTHDLGDLFNGGQRGGVVPPAEGAADDRERRLGRLADEVHRDLTRKHDVLVAALALHLLDRDGVMRGNRQ